MALFFYNRGVGVSSGGILYFLTFGKREKNFSTEGPNSYLDTTPTDL